MESNPHYTRRDCRLAVPPGVGFVEFHVRDVRIRADIVKVSVAGLTLAIDSASGIRADECFPRSVVRVGECHVLGELLVKYAVERDPGRFELGCLFYPSSALAEEKWSAMVSVLHAAVKV